MTKQVKKDIKLREVFEKLKDDIRSLSEELYFLKDQMEPTEKTQQSTDKKYLRILKVKCIFQFLISVADLNESLYRTATSN